MPLSTTITCSFDRSEEASIDARQRRSCAARLRETTTTETRGGSFCSSEVFCEFNLTRIAGIGIGEPAGG